MKRKESLAIWILVILNLSGLGSGAKILVYPFGHCLNSHLLDAEHLSRLLVADGHDVTMLLSYAYDTYLHRQGPGGQDDPQLLQFPAPANYTPICDYDTINFMIHTPLQTRFNAMVSTSARYCEALLTAPGLLQTLKGAGYDLLVVEALDPCGKIIADYVDVPFVVLLSAGLGHFDGNPRPPSYVPAAISPYTSDMSFSQRLANIVMKVAYDCIPVIMGFEAPFEQMKVRYGLNESLRLADTFSRAALKLVNSDFSVDYPAPVEPDSVMIGGYSVDDTPPPLPADLRQFVETSGEHGVIVVSLGTLTKRYDGHWRRVFMDAFSRLPHKIIWRYYSTNDTEDGAVITNSLGGAVKQMRWLPQASLLADNHTRLFVTHAGMHGLFETTRYGVPVLTLPLSGDQFQNAAKLTQHLGMGESLDIYNVDAQQLYDGIRRVLDTPHYTENARQVSRRTRDQPMTSSNKAVYWLNYVIRHAGAKHLKSRAHKLTWYEYHSLDVISCIAAFMLAIVSTAAYILIKLLSALVKYSKNTLHAFSTQKNKLE